DRELRLPFGDARIVQRFRLVGLAARFFLSRAPFLIDSERERLVRVGRFVARAPGAFELVASLVQRTALGGELFAHGVELPAGVFELLTDRPQLLARLLE